MKDSYEDGPAHDGGKNKEPEVPASVLAELMRAKNQERQDVRLENDQSPEEYAKGIADALKRAKENPPQI